MIVDFDRVVVSEYVAGVTSVTRYRVEVPFRATSRHASQSTACRCAASRGPTERGRRIECTGRRSLCECHRGSPSDPTPFTSPGPPRAGLRVSAFALNTVNIVVREDLKSYIEPLTPDEHDALERSLLAEGCRDALVLWGDVLVDGHNRYGLCQKHGLPFNTVQNPRFQSIEDVYLWMIDQHLGRRSVSDFQRGVLALRKKEIVTARQEAAKAARKDANLRAEVRGEAAPADSPLDGDPVVAAEPPIRSREDIAKAARLSPTQVTMIEKIQKQAAPEVVAAVRAGTITLNAAAAVAGLPVEEQVAAASAGKDELKLAAKRARESNKKPRVEASQMPTTEVQALQDRVAALTAENEYLRGQVAELQAKLGA